MPHPHEINPRFQLYDTVTGNYHHVYGDPVLASVTSEIKQFAMDAMRPGRQRDNNSSNGNFLRGGYGATDTPHTDPMMSRYGPNGPNSGQRNGTGATDQLNANPLLYIVNLLLQRLQGDDRDEFLQGLCGIVGMHVHGTGDQLWERRGGGRGVDLPDLTRTINRRFNSPP